MTSNTNLFASITSRPMALHYYIINIKKQNNAVACCAVSIVCHTMLTWKTKFSVRVHLALDLCELL